MKKILFYFIILWSCISGMAYDFEVDGIYYTITSTSDLTVAVAAGDSKYTGNIVIPSEVHYKTRTLVVKSIRPGAFWNCGGLSSVTIPNSVTSIEGSAFYGCTGLTSITIPNSVTSIGGSAFKGCTGLTSITIPNSVTEIGGFAFESCTGLTNIVIPDSVTSIGEYTFFGCSSLSSVTIPSSVTSIKRYAFDGCSSLKSVTIPNSVTSIGVSAFSNCTGLTSVTIPNSVTSIGSNAFYNCSGLKSVTLEDGDKDLIFSNPEEHYNNPLNTLYIGRNTRVGTNSTKRFKNENIKVLIIGDSVTSIEDSTFAGCSRLNSVTIGNSVRKIGKLSFSGCSALSSVTIPNSVRSIGEKAFSESGLTSVAIPNSVTSIEKYTFYGCSRLKSVTIPNSVTSIGEKAFSESGLTSVTIPSSVTSIEQYTFYHCSSLWSVTIPSSVTSIGDNAFDGCSYLLSVTIPNSVTSIGEFTFYGCSRLKSVTIPNSVTSIRRYTFCDCSSLSSVTIPNSVRSIGSGAFSKCKSLTSVTIPNSVTSIGSNAFYYCTGLKSLTFEDGDENLYLSDPTGLNVCPLDTLYLGRNCKSQSSTGYVKEFPNKNIKVLIVGNHIVRLEGEGLGEKMSSFKDCSELKSVTIGNSVTYIGSSTFSGCEDIETIVSLSTNPPDLISSAFEKTVYTFGTLFVPANAGSAYRSHSVWGKFAEIVELNSLPVYVANVSLDKTSLTFSAFNATQTLTATITPSNASNKTLTWTSSNTNIATVDNNGVVTAKGYGTATITATTTDGSNKSATCSVTVAAPILVTGVSLSQTSLTFSALNTTQTLTATVTPSNADNKTLTWTSSNTNVATVSSSGVVTSKGNGTATITAKATDGSNISATCTVTVIESVHTSISEGYYTIVSAGKGPGYYTGTNPGDRYNDEGKYALYNDSGLVKWKEFDANDYSQIYHITSSGDGDWYIYNLADGSYIDRQNTDAVPLGQSVYAGKVITSTEKNTPQVIEGTNQPGKWTIRFKGNEYVYGLTASHDGSNDKTSGEISIWGSQSETNKFGMNVWYLSNLTLPKATNIVLNLSELALAKGQTRQLAATVSPANALPVVAWGSSDPDVATVSEDGLITAKGYGTATITATTTDGSNKSATCSVTVTAPFLVTGVSLSQTSLTFSALNTTQTLTATVTPSNATNKTLTWTSSNTNVATVSSNGVVTSKGNGTATITAKATDGSNKSATCSVTVDAPILVTSVYLSQTSLTFSTLNTTQTLTATVTPSNAANKNLEWTSSNPDVATVSSSGVVTSKGNGTTTITATTTDGSNKSATCSVTVDTNINLTDIAHWEVSYNASYGYTFKDIATGLYMNTKGNSSTHQAITYNVGKSDKGSCWKLLDSKGNNVVSFNTQEKYYLYNLGGWQGGYAYENKDDQRIFILAPDLSSAEPIQFVSDGNGYYYICMNGKYVAQPTQNIEDLKLKEKTLATATSISIDYSELSLEIGQTQYLKATVTPTEALQSVTWKSSNESVATVSENGLVTAKSNGTARITATTADGSNLSATCTVTVMIPVDGISLSNTSLTFSAIDSKETLTATVTPSNASNKNLEWTSSNPDVATVTSIVSNRGVVTAKGNGTATITARTKDGSNISATCTVTVTIPVDGISLSNTSLTFSALNTTQTLTATVSPSSAANKKLTWTSSNTNVATVNSNGVVTSKGNGTATITAKATDGSNISATCSVTVSAPILVTGVSLNKTSLTFSALNTTQTLTATITPSDASNKILTWTSSNTDVATVNIYGVVTSKGYGTATITAKATDGSNKSATCSVTVVIPKYTLKFVADGKVVSESSVEYGSTITVPAAPAKTGYTFVSWGDVATTMPAKDLTYTAQYKVNQYKLTYMIDGRVYKTYTLDYNSVINPEDNAEDDDYFYGWEDIPDRMPDHDVQVNAYITKVLGWAKSIDDKTAIYTLDGQKVVNPIKGNIYIINGKKVRY